jgi:hypothetical protein
MFIGTFMKIHTPEIVLIEWHDAAHEFGWMDGNDIKDEDIDLTCFTVGWILKKTSKYIKLCQTYSDDNHAQTIVIPNKMVKNITSLKKESVQNVE